MPDIYATLAQILRGADYDGNPITFKLVDLAPGFAWAGSAVTPTPDMTITVEKPTGLINSSNTVFTTSVTPGTLLLFLNGVLLNALADFTIDYTLSTATITMTVAPETGNSLTAVSFV